MKTKITKSQLKSKLSKLVEGDEFTVQIIPSKANSESEWFKGSEYIFTVDGNNETYTINDLDKLINSIKVYQCNAEVGNSVAYYI